MPGHRILFIILIFYSAISNAAVSQVYYDSTLLTLLLSDSSDYQRSYCRTPLIWDNQVRQVGNAIKQGNLIYFLPDQYGAVFRAEKIGDSIRLERVDKTTFSGYNGGHYCFIYNNEIYSFGGYGVWRTNGQLRKFIRSKGEWDIVQLDRELPSYNEFTYYDNRANLLWCGEQAYVNQVLSSDKYRIDQKMFSLDLKRSSWKERGEFISDKTFRDFESSILCETPRGALIYTAGPSFEILDFRGNTRYKLNDISDSLFALAKPDAGKPFNYFFINGKIIVYDYKLQRITYQIRLDNSKLTVAKTPVYQTRFALDPSYLAFFSICVVGIIGISFFRGRLKKPIQISPTGNGTSRSEPYSFKDRLSSIENEVLIKIKTDTLAGSRTTTNDLNKILGTDKKTLEIQKAQRSKILTSINDKYNLYYKKNIKLINVIRMEEDRRVVEYYIDQEAMSYLKD
jgi:hypothetical protein